MQALQFELEMDDETLVEAEKWKELKFAADELNLDDRSFKESQHLDEMGMSHETTLDADKLKWVKLKDAAERLKMDRKTILEKVRQNWQTIKYATKEINRIWSFRLIPTCIR